MQRSSQRAQEQKYTMHICLLLTRFFNAGKKKGQQTNAVRILVAAAFKNDLAKSELALETSYSARQIRGMGGHVKMRSSTEYTVLFDVSRLLGRKVNFNLLLILFVLLSVLRRQ